MTAEDRDDSITEHAQLLADIAEHWPERTTVLTEVRERLVDLVGAFKLETERGSIARLFFNALLQDLHVIEEAVRQRPNGESEQTWLEPLLETLISKLALGTRVYPEGATRFHTVAEQLGRLRAGAREWATARLMLGGLLDGPSARSLHPQARACLENPGLPSALEALRDWSSDSAGPPIFVTAIGQVIEALALHLAIAQAHHTSTDPQHDEAIEATLSALADWLLARGVTPIEPQPGSLISGSERVVFRRIPTDGRRGAIDALIAPGFRIGTITLARPTVLVNPGAGSRVLEAAHAILNAAPAEERDRFAPTLVALQQRLWNRLDDPESPFLACVDATLAIVEALRPLNQGAHEASLLQAFLHDFDGTGLELVAPAPQSRPRPAPSLSITPRHAAEVPPGQLIRLDRYGLELDGEVLRPAELTVSHGPAPRDRLSPLLAALQLADPELPEARTQRLYEALDLRPGDGGRALALELLDGLDLPPRSPEVLEALLDTLLELELPALSELDGWLSLTQLLASLRSALADDPGARRLIRSLSHPYREALKSPEALSELPLRRLDALLGAPLQPLPSEVREQLFNAALTELRNAHLQAPKEDVPAARHLIKTAARLLASLWNASGDDAPLKRCVATLQGSGMQIHPSLDGAVSPCEAPELLFARLDARYHESEARGQSIGPVYPALEWGCVVEPGFLRVSLGPRSRLAEWLRSREGRSSPLGFATRRMVAELSQLDRQRLVSELEGDAAARPRYEGQLRELILDALTRAGVSLSHPDPQTRALLDILREEQGVDLSA